MLLRRVWLYLKMMKKIQKKTRKKRRRRKSDLLSLDLWIIQWLISFILFFCFFVWSNDLRLKGIDFLKKSLSNHCIVKISSKITINQSWLSIICYQKVFMSFHLQRDRKKIARNHLGNVRKNELILIHFKLRIKLRFLCSFQFSMFLASGLSPFLSI